MSEQPTEPGHLEAPAAEPTPRPQTPAWEQHFEVGELFPWRGVTFSVAAVGPAGILLQPVNVNLRKLAKSGPVSWRDAE